VNKTIEQARADLLGALPYFRNAVARARAKEMGQVKLGILCENPDGSGNIEMSFECDAFFDDLASVLGAPPQTDEDNGKAAALRFMQQHGFVSK
jgi:hypothetical protein